MSTELGCGFCQREGLPVFLARPAIIGEESSLPKLKGNVKIPVEAKGETAYTARILREGFLYVYSENFNSWETYTIDSKGHYCLQPERSCIPQCLESEKKTLCTSNASKVARSSFITLYIMPKKQENGVFWFAWSEAPWSEEMKKQHEDKEHRIKNMQSFDVDKWLKGTKHENTEFLRYLESTVSEYYTPTLNMNAIPDALSKSAEMVKESKVVKTIEKSKLAKSIKEIASPVVSDISEPVSQSIKGGYELITKVSEFKWDFFYGKTKEAANNLLNEANKLFPEKGAIVFLHDPVAILKELSELCNFRIKNNYITEKHSRGLALSSMLSGLKQGLCDQKRSELESSDQSEAYLSEIPSGPCQPVKMGEDPIFKKKVAENLDKFDQTRDKRVKDFWDDKYEIYIDRDKEKLFFKEFDQDFSVYVEEVISPMIGMYLNWLKSDILKLKMKYNYDPNDEACSLLYIQSVEDVIQGMINTEEVKKFLFDKLIQKKIDDDNFILRAMVANNDKLAKQINGVVSLSNNYASLPWNKIFDGVVETIGKLNQLSQRLESYAFTINNILIKIVNKFIDHAPLPIITMFTIKGGMKIETIRFKGSEVELIKAVSKHLTKMGSLSGKISDNTMKRRVAAQLKKAGIIEGNTSKGNQQSKEIIREYKVLTDINQAKQISKLPMSNDAKGAEIIRTITTEKELKEHVFRDIYYNMVDGESNFVKKAKEVQGKIDSPNVQSKLKDTQLSSATASFVFQFYALAVSRKDASKDFENGTKFCANVIGAVGTGADMLERALAKWRNYRYVAKLPYSAGTAVKLTKFQNVLSATSRYLSIAAAVGVAWDIYHAYDEFFNKEVADQKLGLAYIASAASSAGLILLALQLTALGGPLGIIACTLILFGSAIYILTQDKDKIQKWLLACQWRKIPIGEKGVPYMWANQEQEVDAFKTDVLGQ
ncbi:T6SS effector BTH_I2691 family protein [Xenorhabdus szentirmaii]|uniref:Toxin VasX N-terminal region domain-containing protein n=1 Tax=Xenorhabdus szentirmaii DSM 16338 TaxID=1427518 RepID=W1J5P8_9GAMM|nr:MULTISPECIES: T6SS effector BTH_I2691 family protein [Xenorhabdus]MBD2822415.1 hypothetical protein [Xenorhabdus sp. 42]MBD2827038.1 hypothetical protein [Xenorhabdus sp. 5]PHM31437.1 hypothetical protein Xsze_02132 [Xenorhabdus szentirmaii DSM 16338]PHM42184.1 hypothetical protein Xszus_01914 [Xenorhabdus szentirmaii]CDL84790.1 membrane hypothetical protein [Xenorhabdus szentirmaii DSM 16338]